MRLINKQEITQKLNENHYSEASIGVYQSWIGRFVKYHNIELTQFKTKHISEYLASLALKNLKSSTYNQALNAIVFFYNKILNVPINKSFVSELRLTHSVNLPDVLTKEQIDSIIYHLKGSYQLLVYLLYGCGLRSSEALNLKIKDIDTNKNQLTVSNIKYFRVLSIPTKISSELNTQIDFVTQMHT
ncbi:MAG: phage integrase N-terminal SAM-like domain-containing protein, partial [Candidatus Thioglobus sp.]|uniref:phage integrase N-terminal SAM-like domain-containing protein n=1 Tax=Candidatus Thioglobus sp. TaxID=2026721 RepID=UPI00261F51D0